MMEIRERYERKVIEEADIDPKLVEHAHNCDERFCQNFRKLLNYTVVLRMPDEP